MQPIFLRLTDVLIATGLSKASIYRQIKAGDFPSPVKLGRRRVGWRESDLEVWSAERKPTLQANA